jgi:hypothetical protein
LFPEQNVFVSDSLHPPLVILREAAAHRSAWITWSRLTAPARNDAGGGQYMFLDSRLRGNDEENNQKCITPLMSGNPENLGIPVRAVHD